MIASEIIDVAAFDVEYADDASAKNQRNCELGADAIDGV